MVDEPSYELSFSLRHVAAVLDGSRASLRALSVPSDLLEFIRIKAPDLLVLPLEGRTGAEALEAAGPILSALAYTESSILVLRY